MAIFITSVLVVSAFGLPIILARAPIAAPVVQKITYLLPQLDSTLCFNLDSVGRRLANHHSERDHLPLHNGFLHRVRQRRRRLQHVVNEVYVIKVNLRSLYISLYAITLTVL